MLVEEWLWEPLQRLMQQLARLPVLRQISQGIARLPARWAAVVFVVPVLALFPFKLGGLWLIAHGKVALGVGVFIAAKIVGTALFAWLFALTKPALLSLPWFARAYGWVIGVRDTVHHWIRRQRAYRLTRLLVRRWPREIRRWWAAQH